MKIANQNFVQRKIFNILKIGVNCIVLNPMNYVFITYYTHRFDLNNWIEFNELTGNKQAKKVENSLIFWA